MLIIDEVSMMSKRTFEMLEYVLRLKDPGHRFGGIQVILVGDFMQLPPVRNKRYGDEGEFCFTSSFFPPHSIILEEIMRQSDGQLIKCIRELSKGSCSEDSLELLEQLSRPLSNTMPIKLYTTNILVDMFNRDQLLEKPGEVYVFDSVDIGDVKHLEELTVQPTIWLKVGAPVMLLRNLTNSLVNGLRGIVTNIYEGMAVVYFPSVTSTVTVKRMSFPGKIQF